MRFRRLLCYALVSGITGSVIFKAADEGIISGQWILVVPIAVIGLIVAALAANRDWGIRSLQVSIALIVLAVSWSFAGYSFPDPADLYFRAKRIEIEAQWKTDPISKIVYFPIDYTRGDDGWFPRNFYVLDKAKSFVLNEYGDALLSPSCPFAHYNARRVNEDVLVVRFFLEGPEDLRVLALSILLKK